MGIPVNFLGADKALATAASRTEKEVMKAYNESLKKVQAQLAEAYAKFAQADGTVTYAEMAKYGRLEALEKNVRGELNKMTGSNAAKLNRAKYNLYSESYFRTAFAIEKAAQAKLSYTLLNPNVVNRAIENPLTHLAQRGLRQNLLIRINQQITQGLIQGLSYPKMAKGVKEVIQENEMRSLRIARTEAHRVQQAGRYDSAGHAEDLGIKMTKVWDAAIDNVTRDAHASLDGTAIPMDEDFVSENGGSGPRPGQMNEASDDINCRCSIRFEIEEFKSDFRRVRGEGVIPYKTFSEYSKDKGLRL